MTTSVMSPVNGDSAIDMAPSFTDGHSMCIASPRIAGTSGVYTCQEVKMGLFDKITGKDDDKGTPKADFSDVSSGSSTTAPAGATSAAAPAASEREYTVVSGDSLSAIAKREYGDASRWHAIYEANRDTISNPDLIHPGQKLRLPSKS